jgi:radical SAM superfamily enzyme YgiQ (UPF0313 family)
MKLLFIMPCVGRKPGESYVKTWRMEPLGIATLSALTPPRIERLFCDDRFEEVPFDSPVDAVAMSVETYTARRSYAIAERFRERSIPVIMGGFHPTLLPEEAAAHADCIVTGNAETIWEELIDDLCAKRLKKSYHGDGGAFSPVLPDRTIYRGRRYTKLTLIETGRGCPFTCEFCSIASFFGRRYHTRLIDEVVREIRVLNPSMVFFIDDNIAVDRDRTIELLKAIAPLRIRWCGQVSLAIAQDEELLLLMKKSGCMGVLIGFESLDNSNLDAMGKAVNRRITDYGEAVAAFRRLGMGIYATFVFGYDGDTEETFEKTLAFALKERFFFAAFNHLVPFPGTPLYQRLSAEGRLLHKAWWLEPDYRFGDVTFKPKNFTPEQLTQRCLDFRRKFYSVPSILRRGLDFKANCRSSLWSLVYLGQNITAQGDVEKRQGLRLGGDL